MMIFNPTNWYWIVAGSTTQVFSSALGDYVPTADATFLAWLDSGGLPTNIDTEANLGEVLTAYQLRPVNANVLNGYTTSLASKIVNQALFKILLNHENRIRTIERSLSLNGSPANLPAGQALAAVKALM